MGYYIALSLRKTGFDVPDTPPLYAWVAQLDRATDYESVG